MGLAEARLRVSAGRTEAGLRGAVREPNRAASARGVSAGEAAGSAVGILRRGAAVLDIVLAMLAVLDTWRESKCVLAGGQQPRVADSGRLVFATRQPRDAAATPGMKRPFGSLMKHLFCSHGCFIPPYPDT